MSVSKRILSFLVASVLVGVSANAASATTSLNPNDVEYGTYTLSSTLTIVDDATGTKTVTKSHETVAANPAAIATPAAFPGDLAIHCNTGYNPSDANGTYSIQHACGGSTAPWAYKISPALCARATSTVAEAGMSWQYNGVSKPRQAPHNESCLYTFHGTYNPATDYSTVTYEDTFIFSLVTNGKPSKATLSIAGKLNLLGSPCSPTNC